MKLEESRCETFLLFCIKIIKIFGDLEQNRYLCGVINNKRSFTYEKQRVN